MGSTNPVDVPPAGPGRKAPTVVLAGSFVLLVGALVWVLWNEGASPGGGASSRDPMAAGTPWKNVRPDVAYVGDAACARCHQAISESFRRHPMGRSLAPISDAGGDPAKSPVSFEAAGSRFTIDRRGGRTIHRETRLDEKGRVLAEVEADVAYVLGSGTRGASYLVERDGRLFQSPIAWYTQKQKWDIAPGYAQLNVHFDRPIEAGCLFCHANRVEPVDRTVNRYVEPIFRGHAIGCERCHGPGALHVRSPGVVDGRDPTIVNPRHLEPALRVAVCEQCHVLGVQRVEREGKSPFDYRPGLPTSAVLAIYGRVDEVGNKAVDHVSQMKASRCYRESRGGLDCTSCHDPHQLPSRAEKVEYYRRQCLECHESRGCRLPRPARLTRSPADDCVRCHMPRIQSVDIAHTATTDHRILRTPEATSPAPSPAETTSPLVLLNGEGLSPTELAGLDRELAIALASEAPRMPATPRTRRIGAEVLAELDRILMEHPDDLVARRMKAMSLAMAGRGEDAIREVQTVIRSAPGYEKALDEGLSYALNAGNAEALRNFARQAVAVDPWSSTFHERLAYAAAQSHDWDAAVREAREALRINPFLRFARMFVVQGLLHRDEPGRAREEFEILVALHPNLRASLDQWYAEQRRGTGPDGGTR